jgi:hypothetical protein
MKPQKWAKEIKAWADGAEIEYHFETGAGSMSGWAIDHNPNWNDEECSFRIKPQPKEPQYLYVYQNYSEAEFASLRFSTIKKSMINDSYIGKIKLEVDDE